MVTDALLQLVESEEINDQFTLVQQYSRAANLGIEFGTLKLGIW